MTLLDSPILFLATTDPARSRQFYEKTLGLKFIDDEPFALVFQVGDRTLRIQKVESPSIVQHTVLGWSVANIRKAVETFSKNGVSFERWPHLPQDNAGIWNSPSGAMVAWFKDPDGNTLSLTQTPG